MSKPTRQDPRSTQAERSAGDAGQECATGSRLRLVHDADVPAAPRSAHVARKVGSGRKVKIESWACSPCSARMGFSFGHLIRVRVGAQVIGGKLKGGHWWWACACCQKPYFQDDPVR